MFGGAFNPPHIAHLVLAQEAIWQLGLSSVVLVPTGKAPHKVIESDPGAEVRLEMARLAANGGDRLSVSATEVEREGLSYAYETLEQLAADDPETELYLLMGADAALGFDKWEKPERVLELAKLGVARRPWVEQSDVRSALGATGAADRAEFFSMPGMEVSSTAVRERLREGQPIHYLVPDGVAELIQSRGLYG